MHLICTKKYWDPHHHRRWLPVAIVFITLKNVQLPPYNSQVQLSPSTLSSLPCPQPSLSMTHFGKAGWHCPSPSPKLHVFAQGQWATNRVNPCSTRPELCRSPVANPNSPPTSDHFDLCPSTEFQQVFSYQHWTVLFTTAILQTW